MYTPLLSFTVSGNVRKNVAQQNVECIHLTALSKAEAL